MTKITQIIYHGTELKVLLTYKSMVQLLVSKTRKSKNESIKGM